MANQQPPTGIGPSTSSLSAPTAWHPSVETQVRLSLAALLLLVMVILLAEAWCSRWGYPSVKSDEPPPQWTESTIDPPLASKLCAHLWGRRFQGPGWVTCPMQQCTRFLSNLKQRIRGTMDESSPL